MTPHITLFSLIVLEVHHILINFLGYPWKPGILAIFLLYDALNWWTVHRTCAPFLTPERLRIRFWEQINIDIYFLPPFMHRYEINYWLEHWSCQELPFSSSFEKTNWVQWHKIRRWSKQNSALWEQRTRSKSRERNFFLRKLLNSIKTKKK